jgi:serine/threonine-protein kinase
VHRDVKPGNVLLTRAGGVKVTDFGIARAGTSDGLTQTGSVMGTATYFSPEQAQGLAVDGRSDVYSLGVVLYELLTGEVPFTGDNFVAIAMQHINAPPPPVSLKRPEVPRRVEAAIERALSKDPAQRFQTMGAFERELEACLEELRAGDDAGATGILPVVKPPRARPGRSHRGRKWLVALLALLAAAAIGTAVYVAIRNDGSSNQPGGGAGTGGAIRVQAVSAYDPEGDGHENDGEVPLATDGKLATAWQTEHYANSDFGNLKSGVGLVLDAGSAVEPRSLTIQSDSPGYTAVIKSGNSPTGPFTADSSAEPAGATATFELNGATARYFLIWITNLGPSDQVSVNEAAAR